MKSIIYRSALVLLSLLAMASFAHGQELTAAKLDKYLTSVETLNSSENETLQMINSKMENQQDINFDVDENGEISIMTQIVKQFTDKEVNALEGLIKKTGFSSLQEWTKMGDKLSAAIMAIEMTKESKDMLIAAESQLPQLPPETRKQVEGAIRMMKAAQKIPESDIATVKAIYPRLQKIMGN